MATINWNKIAKVNFDDDRRAKHGQTTGRQLFEKIHDDLAKAKQAHAQRAEVEPFLRKSLLDHMVNRKPITVLVPIQTPSEVLVKSDWGAEYQEQMITIPVGTILTYVTLEKSLGQWIFENQKGEEVTIYNTPTITFGKNPMQNPGFYGLLFNTNLINEIEE
ncbi:MAG: hypothetical protein DRN81_03220 [Thermoproteota archaeon]|nr:MAG: hypothetical protein DRN81_03220 [Candidatus Korarchaeota archaeon]